MNVFGFSPESLLFGYLLLFGGAAFVCFVSLRRIATIEDRDSRRGLAALLVLSGGWAASHVGYLAAPSSSLQYGFYVVGLVIGLATVGPWLYFCSAYTGRSLHRNRTIQGAGIGVFLAITALKLTNPFHHQYFSTDSATEPFAYLAIQHEPAHWVVMGLAYALAFVGFFMLFELFTEVSYDTKPLFGIVALTGVPVAFDLASTTTPSLVEFSYSPLGVSAFAIGILYVYTERFQAIQLTGDTDDPVILLDADDRIRDYNRAAKSLFPALHEAHGKPLETIVPSVAETLKDPVELFEIDRDEGTQYYRISTNPFTADYAQLGRLITLSDVSHREQYRQLLEQQNAHLEEFARIISHDLRNPLSVAKGRVDFAMEEDDTEHLVDAIEALDRMDELISDLLSLAQQGQQIADTEPVEIGALAETSWTMIEMADASLSGTEALELIVEADKDRLQQLFENLFRNAIEHGGHDVTITVGALSGGRGFYIEDDGDGISMDDTDALFEPGFTTASGGTGFGLAIVSEIVDGHEWTVCITDASSGGARFEIRTTTE